MAENLVKKVVFPQFPQLQTDDSDIMRVSEHLRSIALWSKQFENMIDQSLGALDTGGVSNIKEIIDLISGTPQDGFIITYNNTGPTLDWTDPNAHFIGLVEGTPGDGQVPKYDMASGKVHWRDDEVGTPGGGEANVQVDWNVTDTTSDAFILNKPTIPSGFLDLENTPDSWGSLWQIPAVNTTRDGFIWISGPVGWAQRGNATQIPLAKIPQIPYTQITGAPTIPTAPAPWAETGNTDLIPQAKLPALSDQRILFPDATTGVLRDPTASDFNTTTGRGNVVGWSGTQWKRVLRTLIAAHSASGTFTEVAENTLFPLSGVNYRYRGVHDNDGDIASPAHYDIYYSLAHQQWRHYYLAFNLRWGEFDSGIRNVIPYVDIFSSETDALGHATANGQYFLYPTSGVTKFYRLSGFTAAAAEHYEYRWENLPSGGGAPSADGIVFPDAMGQIRPGTADDWDEPNSLSKVVAWTGTRFQEITRVPVPKSATFTAVPDGTNLGGTTNPRWRTFHHQDGQVTNPQNNDLYYNLTNNVFRYRQGGNWSNLSADHFAITGAGIVSGTVFPDQAAALSSSSLTANGQRVMYAVGGGHDLFTVSDFVAAHNSYPWANVYALWAEAGDTGIIPQVKLGTGTADATKFLRGDGRWETPPTSGGGGGEPTAFTAASYTFSVPLSSGQIRFTRANGTTFDLVMLMPFVNAQTVRNSIVEPWATRGESDRVPLAKLMGPVTSLSNWNYNLSTRRLSLVVNRINESNVTLQGPPFPDWITAADVEDWAETGNTDDIPPVKLGSGVRDGTRFLRDDGAWEAIPAPAWANITGKPTIPNVSPWALVGDTTIIPTSKLPSFIVPVYDWAKAANTDVIPVAKLGSGSPSTATFLRGDGSWAVITGGGGVPVAVTKETLKVVRYGTTYEVVGSILESHSSNQQAHGLGQLPDGFEVYLECTTADKSYSVGDKVHLANTPPWRETIHFDAANIYVITRNQGWGILSKGSTTGASSNIDLSDWKLVIKPYIYEDKEIVTGVTGGGGSGYDNFIQLDDTPASYGTVGQFLAVNSSRDGLVFVNAPSGGSGGLTEAQVRAWIADWAEDGNTSFIPTSKIPNLDANKITTGVFDYRRIAAGVFGADKIPVGNTAGTGLEWEDKPTSYPGDNHVKDFVGGMVTATSPLSWVYDATARTVALTSSARTEAQVNTQIEARRDFEWCSATVTATSTAVTIALDGEGTGAASTERILAINYISVFASTRPDSLPVFMTYNGQNSGNVQLFGADNTRRNMTLGDLRTYGHTNVMHMFRRRSGGWDWVGTSGAASVAQDVTSLIKSWALTANASTRVPVAQMGSGTASSSTWLRGDGSWQSLPALTAAQITALVSGSPGNNRIIGYDTSNAGLKWYDLPTGGGMADGVVDDVTFSLSGQALTLTLGRTNNLADISDTITLPAGTDNYVDTAAMAVSGQTLTLTLGRTGSLTDLTATATLPSGGGGTSTPDLYKVGNSDVSYSTVSGRRRVNLTISGADNSVGTLILFQWADATLTPAGNEVEVGVNGSGYVRIKWDNPVGGSLENITLGDITRYNYYMLYRAGSFWHKIGGTVEALGTGGSGLTESQVRALIADWAETGNLTNIPVDKLGNVHSWARGGNTDRLPENKMTGYPTGFSIAAAGAQTIGWQMQRQGLTNLTGSSILLPGLPSTITGSLSGTDLTLIMTRTGTGGNITSSAIDLSGLSGGGGTVSDEHIRDTIASFATEGVGIAIHHDDPGNKLIFSADPHFEQVQTLILFTHTGDAFRLNRDRPTDLFQVGTNVPGTSSGATYHRADRRVYVVTTAGNIQRSSVNALSGWTSVGTLPTGRGEYQALASNGTVIYAISEDGLTQVNLSNVGSSTYMGAWPTGLFGLGGATFHLDVLHLISASTRKVHTVPDLTSPGSAEDKGRMPTGFVGVPWLLVSAGGRLYTTEAHTNGMEFWEVNPSSPGSSIERGQVYSGGGNPTISAGLAIDVRLDTTYIPEGNNLYFTNERVDDRVNSLLLVDNNQLLEKTYNDSANRLTLKVDIEHTETTSPTAHMERLTMAGVTRQVRNTYEIGNTGELPPLTENILGQMYFNKADRHIYVGIDDPHTQNTPSGTFNAITARSDLHVVTALPADLNALTAGHYYYLHAQGWNDGFYVVAVRYGVNELVASNPTTALAASRTSNTQGVVFLGAEQRATDALRFTYSVSSGSDYFWLDLGASPPTFKILDQSTFVAAGGTTHHYQFWRAGFVLPAGQPGQYLKLAADGVTPEFATIAAGGDDAYDWATEGNTEQIPANKIPDLGADKITTGVFAQARFPDFAASKITSGVFDVARIPNLSIVDKTTGTLPISRGGTGATTAADARTNLGALGSVATDNTIDGDGTSGNPLSVSVNDVTEELQESIQHFTSGALNFSGKGATVGHCFTSGPYRTQISRVTVYLDAPNSGGTFVARIYTLHTNNQIATHLANSNTRTLSHRRNESFDFTAGGHTIPTNSRIGVLISRTDDGNGGNARMRVGSEASSSPSESYDDASIDFNRLGWVEYEHTNPPSNQSTHTHDTDGSADVYGDMRIQYRRIFDHGSFVGDGNVDETHINTENATPGQLLAASSTDRVEYVNAGPTFNTAVNTNIDFSTANEFVATGFTGWSGKSVILISFGAETSSGGDVRFAGGFHVFVADLLAIPNTASAGDDIDITTTGRNVLRFQLLDRSTGSTPQADVIGVGRTSGGELLVANPNPSEDAYPFRAVAL